MALWLTRVSNLLSKLGEAVVAIQLQKSLGQDGRARGILFKTSSSKISRKNSMKCYEKHHKDENLLCDCPASH